MTTVRAWIVSGACAVPRAIGARVSADERRTREQRDVAFSAQQRQGSHQRLRLDHARVRREQRRFRRNVRLAGADERLVHDPEALHSVALAADTDRFKRLDLVASCATISFPHRA